MSYISSINTFSSHSHIIRNKSCWCSWKHTGQPFTSVGPYMCVAQEEELVVVHPNSRQLWLLRSTSARVDPPPVRLLTNTVFSEYFLTGCKRCLQVTVWTEDKTLNDWINAKIAAQLQVRVNRCCPKSYLNQKIQLKYPFYSIKLYYWSSMRSKIYLP